MKSAKWALAILAFLILIPIEAGGARAAPLAGKSVTVERRDMDFTILPTGNVRVRETWQVAFHGGAFTYAFREIPFNHVEAITDWNVAEGERRYLRAASGGQPYTYTLTTSATGEKIVWYFPPTTNATRTFTLSYTLQGALWIDAKGDQFFWKAIESDRSYTIQHAEATIYLPGKFNPNDILTATYKNSRQTGSGTLSDGDTVYFEGGPFPGGTEWEIRVQWPHGHVSASPPPWQHRAKIQPWINLGWALLLFLLVAGSVGGGFLLWYLRGRDPKVAQVPGIISQPPSNLPPGIVGTLVDEIADMDDILATLLDLARRGFLRIENRQQKSREEIYFVAQEWPKRPWRHERLLLQAIFGRKVIPGKQRSLESLKDHFYTALPEIRAALYHRVVAVKLFPANPEKVRKRYTKIAIFIGGLIAALALPGMWTGAKFMGTLAPIAGILVGSALLIVAHFMPRKTRKGAIEAAKWRAFERYLREIERHTAIEQARDLFEKYLPYATAFGISSLWVKKFTRVPNMPAPRWYTIRSLHSSSWEYGGIQGNAEGSEHATTPTQGEAPSLDHIADGAMSSFSDMANSLIGTLNFAASTFTSSPSSSGDGGFSGGGFSGGGGGGGSSGFG